MVDRSRCVSLWKMNMLCVTLALACCLIFVTTTEAVKEVVKFSVDDVCNLKFSDCGSVAGKLISATANVSCPSGVAILQRNTAVLIDFQFEANNAEAVLTSKVAGKIGVLPWAHFPLGNPDACKDSGLTCPIQANTALNYKPILNILEDYPPLSVVVRWELQNKDEKDVFCIYTPVTIK